MYVASASRQESKSSHNNEEESDGMHATRLKKLNFFGRKQELQALHDAFKSVEEERESLLFTICGPSGTGKSKLVDTFRGRIGGRALFCAGKCEMNRSTEPFSFLKDSLQTLCATLISDLSWKDRLDDLSKDVRDAVGAGGSKLSEIVPEAEVLVGKHTISSHESDVLTAQDRIKYLFRSFIRALTKHVPLILFCDDLQWIDESSLKLLSWLAIDHQMERFMLLVTYRDNEISDEHTVSKELKEIALRKDQNLIYNIKLKSLSSKEVTSLVGHLLESSINEVAVLGNLIHKKTLGNFLFVMLFIQLLEQESLLTYSESQMKWSWADPETISDNTALAVNSVDLIARKLKQLPDDIQRCLIVASCISSTISVPVLSVVISRMDCKPQRRVEELLLTASSERFLHRETKTSETPARYRFAHDRIQQAAYSLVPQGPQRDQMHFEIGCVLLGVLDQLSESHREWIRFIAPNQLQLGMSCMTVEEDYVSLSTLHLQAGQRSITLSAFMAASEYLRKGIEVMNNVVDAWEKYRKLMLSLHQSYAEVLLCVGKPKQSEEVARQIRGHAESTDERFRANRTLAQSLGYQSRHKEAVDVDIQQLQLLGVIPNSLRPIKAVYMLLKLHKILKSVTENDIMKLPECTDKRIAFALEMLTLLSTHATFCGQHVLLVLGICTMTKLVLRHGVAGGAQSCFAQIGVHLSILFGDAKEAVRLGSLTMRLVERFGEADLVGPLVVLGFLRPWCHPLSETLEPFLQHYKSGMKLGNIEMAFGCFCLYLHHAFMSGLCLGALLEDARNQIEAIEEYGILGIQGPLLPLCQMILNLQGSSHQPTVLSGDAMDEQTFLEGPQSNYAYHAFNLQKMTLCYYFGCYKEADQVRAKAHKTGKTNTTFYELATLLFFDAMIPLTRATTSGSSAHKRRARMNINKIRRAVTKYHKGMNLSHRLLLLDAGYFALGSRSTDENLVVQAFDKAIKLSTRAGFRQDAALANLHAGEYHLSRTKDREWASHYISRAIELFDDWGATGVAQHLKEKYDEQLDLKVLCNLGSTNHMGRQRHSSEGSRQKHSLVPDLLVMHDTTPTAG